MRGWLLRRTWFETSRKSRSSASRPTPSAGSGRRKSCATRSADVSGKTGSSPPGARHSSASATARAASSRASASAMSSDDARLSSVMSGMTPTLSHRRRGGKRQAAGAFWSPQNSSSSLKGRFSRLFALSAPPQNGSAPAQNSFAASQNRFAATQHAFAAMQHRSASAQNGSASLQSGFVTTQMAFAVLADGSCGGADTPIRNPNCSG